MFGLMLASPVAPQQIATGGVAAQQFVYMGKPVHPFCVDFPLEGSSRPGPFPLAKCSDTKVVAVSKPDGWLEAEYPHKDGEFFVSHPPYISYRVLARKGERFLIGSESSGGGSGQFSALFWVRLTSDQIGVVKDEMGGDRCGGSLSGYAVEGRDIAFNVDTPAGEILAQSGISIDKSITDQLRSGYRDCDGASHYRYNLTTEKKQLTSLKLNVPDPPGSDAAGPQACFDRLVLEYGKKKQTVLGPEALKKFGREFAAKCTGSRHP
jgi:hypothetical protein